MFWILVGIFGFIVFACIFGTLLVSYLEYKRYRTSETETMRYYNEKALFGYDVEYVKCKEMPLFNFEAFLKFYYLNSEQWIYYTKDEIVPCPARKEVIIKKFGNYEEVKNIYYPIFFSTWGDYRKYIKWAEAEFKSMKENKNSKRRYENTEEFIKLIQKDIDKKREEAKQDLNKAKELIEGCVNND